MIFKKIILLLVLFLTAATILFAQPTDTEILQRLDGHLDAIGRQYKFSRQVSGGVMIGCGVLIGGLGLMMPSLIDDDSDSILIMTGIFVGVGVGLGIGGVVVLMLPSDYEKIPRAFAELPETTSEEIKAKIAKGEVYLSSLAIKAKNERYLGAGLSAASGVAALAYYFVSTDPDYLKDSFLYEGVGLLASSVVYFIIKSKPESEHEAYMQWKRSKGIAKQQHEEKHNTFVIEPAVVRCGIGISLKYKYTLN